MMVADTFLHDVVEVPPLRGRLEYDVDMSRMVSWRAGGRAERVYTPADVDDLAVFLRRLDLDEPVLFVGLGSNLLVRDGGLHGTVVHLHAALAGLALARDSDALPWGGKEPQHYGAIYAEAGVASPKVARFAAANDLVGAEFLAGIPGTFGGALAMNAGCHGHETWEHVVQVLSIDRRGQIHRRRPEDFSVAYRHVEARFAGEEWFVAAWMLLPRGDGQAARETIKRLLAKRVASQPLQLPNAGSIFRNPPGDHAARLIESCGLKGLRIGGAQVSEKHANFIVNLGGATATDIESLIDTVARTVAARTGINLTREVRIIGEH